MYSTVINQSQKEINISVKESDIGILYIVQHELLKSNDVEFAGVIVKHPLTNELWMRVTSSKGNPVEDIKKASDAAQKIAEDLKKLFNSKIQAN